MDVRAPGGNAARLLEQAAELKQRMSKNVLAVDFVSVLGTLAGASGGGAVTSAVARPVILTKEVVLTWSRPVMAVAFRSRVSESLENCLLPV